MGEANPLLMPKLGLTMTEGLLASWAVAVGDRVHRGDELFTVETDKISTVVEARAEGEILSLDVVEGATVPVGARVASWSGPAFALDADDVEPAAEGSPSAPTPPAVPAPATRRPSTPLARRLAANHAIDLASVEGTGPHGRIVSRDVEGAVTRAATPKPLPPSDPQPIPAPPRRLEGATDRMRAITARRLTLSKQTIPHFYIFADVDVTKVQALRGELNRAPKAAGRVSLTHLLTAGLARALAAFPELNARWIDGATAPAADVGVGIAVDTPKGLLVPVVRGAQQLGVDSLVRAVNALVERARQGRLAPGDMEGATLSISNVGMFGAAGLVPIIDPDQSAILGVGRPKAVFRPDGEGRPVLREELMLTLSCDHRIYDGVSAAKLLERLRTLIEEPLSLLRA